MEVTNIGVIVKNNYGDTLPVSLTQDVVQKIQHLLGGMPTVNSTTVLGPDGKPAAARPSIPIIPRKVAFDWDLAYGAMTNEEKKEAFTVMMEGYAVIEKALGPDGHEGKVVNIKELIEQGAEDKLNPFEMKLNASGRANVDVEEENELAVTKEDTNPERKDETVEVENLGMGAKAPSPGE